MLNSHHAISALKSAEALLRHRRPKAVWRLIGCTAERKGSRGQHRHEQRGLLHSLDVVSTATYAQVPQQPAYVHHLPSAWQQRTSRRHSRCIIPITVNTQCFYVQPFALEINGRDTLPSQPATKASNDVCCVNVSVARIPRWKNHVLAEELARTMEPKVGAKRTNRSSGVVRADTLRSSPSRSPSNLNSHRELPCRPLLSQFYGKRLKTRACKAP